MGGGWWSVIFLTMTKFDTVTQPDKTQPTSIKITKTTFLDAVASLVVTISFTH